MTPRLLGALLASGAILLATTAPAQAGPGQPRTSSDAGTLTSQDLAVRGQGGFPQYRIPALTTSASGTLIAAYDGRPSMADLPSNVATVVRRSTDGGRTWQEQQVVRAEAAPTGYGDPSLLTDRRTGRLFMFYAGSVNRGYASSTNGTSDDDPDVLHADYSYSDDDGVTWTHRRITSMIKNSEWGGMFAASGEGIQLRHGAHAGRLVQQYVVRHDGGNYAVSAYSDDHGETWQMGEPVGPGADENKTVELSDGTVMLNNRKTPYRTVARSTDGGVSYTELTPDTELPDPANNGSITRYAPDAPPSDPRSRWLLFSNSQDTGIRRNLTVRMSCDDGETWPVKKVLDSGSSAYSTMTPLPGGRVGMLYEQDGYQRITYSSFDLEWLGGICAPVEVSAPGEIKAGTATTLDVRVLNQSEELMPAGTVELDLPKGWSADPVAVRPVEPGEAATVRVRVAVADTATGSHAVEAVYRSRSGPGVSYGTSRLEITPDASAPVSPELTVQPVLDNVDIGGAEGIAGDVISYWTRVANTGNTTITGITASGNMDHVERCAYSSLAPGQSYVCKFAKKTVTQEDIDRGFFTASLTLTGDTPAGGITRSGRAEPVDIR